MKMMHTPVPTHAPEARFRENARRSSALSTVQEAAHGFAPRLIRPASPTSLNIPQADDDEQGVSHRKCEGL